MLGDLSMMAGSARRVLWVLSMMMRSARRPIPNRRTMMWPSTDNRQLPGPTSSTTFTRWHSICKQWRDSQLWYSQLILVSMCRASLAMPTCSRMSQSLLSWQGGQTRMAPYIWEA